MKYSHRTATAQLALSLPKPKLERGDRATSILCIPAIRNSNPTRSSSPFRHSPSISAPSTVLTASAIPLNGKLIHRQCLFHLPGARAFLLVVAHEDDRLSIVTTRSNTDAEPAHGLMSLTLKSGRSRTRLIPASRHYRPKRHYAPSETRMAESIIYRITSPAHDYREVSETLPFGTQSATC